MESLLGLFYSRIKGSQEDIASEGLAYILQRSQAARLALSKIIKADCKLDMADIRYLTQNAGEKLERPDISGYNINRKEVVILESKFWAALTDNQPIGYLNRLGQDSALLFICPTLRVRSIFDELIKKLREAKLEFMAQLELYAIVLDSNKHILVKTWDEVLGLIRIHLVQANEQALLSDIDQIIGLCHIIDSNAFLPLQEEDLSPGIARRINSYYDLVDKVADELVKRGVANTNGLKATPQRNGYTRYLHIGIFGVALNLKFDYWAKYADTPFWLTIKEVTQGGWRVSDNLAVESKKVATQLNCITIENNQRLLHFALFPLLNKTEDVVINDLTEHIILLIQVIQNQMPLTNSNS